MWRLASSWFDLVRWSTLASLAIYALVILGLGAAAVSTGSYVVEKLSLVASRAAGIDDPAAALEDAIEELKAVGEATGGDWKATAPTRVAAAPRPVAMSGAGSTLAEIDEATRSGGLGLGTSDGSTFYKGLGGTFRTVCVRLCDGYYWPISFSTTEDLFGRDSMACQQSCGMPARLYVYRAPGGRPEEMIGLGGQPYSRLRTAFQFRVRYDAACSCKAQPWEAEAVDRHRKYAVRAASDEAARKALATTKGSRKAREDAAAAARAEVEAAAAARLAAESSARSTSSVANQAGAAPSPGLPEPRTALVAGASEAVGPSSPAFLMTEAERLRLAEQRAQMEEAMRLGGPGDRESARSVASPSYRASPAPVWELRAFGGN